MKTFKVFLSSFFVVIMALGASAQTHDHNKMLKNQNVVKTETFKVWGKCDMCKARIEKAVKTDGVSSAIWEKKSQMLTVTFDPSSTGIEALSKKLASAGHDTEKFKATDEVYASLPGCCHYERQK